MEKAENGEVEVGIEDLVCDSLQEVLEFIPAKQRVALVEGASDRLDGAALDSWRAIKEVTITIIGPKEVKATQGLQTQVKEEDFLAALKGVLDRAFNLRSLVLNVPHSVPMKLAYNVGVSFSAPPQLRALKIIDSDGTDKSPFIGMLANALCRNLGAQLEELELGFFDEEPPVQWILQSCPLLQKLERKACNEKGNTVTTVHGSLQELRISLQGSGEAYHTDFDAPNLRLLEVKGEECYLRLGARGLNAMAESLRTLHLDGVQIPREDLVFLAGFHVEEICIYAYIGFSNGLGYPDDPNQNFMASWTAEGAPLKSSLKILRFEDSCRIGDEALKKIGRFPNLEELELSGTTLRGVEWELVLGPILTGSERLKSLNIRKYSLFDNENDWEEDDELHEVVGQFGKFLEHLDVSGPFWGAPAWSRLEKLVFGLLKGRMNGRVLAVKGLYEAGEQARQRAIEQCRARGLELTLEESEYDDLYA